MLEQVGFIVLAVVFLTHGGMMFVLLHTIYKQLPHAQFIAVLYVLVCQGIFVTIFCEKKEHFHWL